MRADFWSARLAAKAPAPAAYLALTPRRTELRVRAHRSSQGPSFSSLASPPADGLWGGPRAPRPNLLSRSGWTSCRASQCSVWGLPCGDSELSRYCPLLKPPLVWACGGEPPSLQRSWPEWHSSCWRPGGLEVLTEPPRARKDRPALPQRISGENRGARIVEGPQAPERWGRGSHLPPGTRTCQGSWEPTWDHS